MLESPCVFRNVGSALRHCSMVGNVCLNYMLVWFFPESNIGRKESVVVPVVRSIHRGSSIAYQS